MSNVHRYSRTYKKGQVIFREGDPDDCAFIIETGRVQISTLKGAEVIALSVLGPGEIFGEMAIIDGLPRSASAAALEDCELSVITRDQLQQRIEVLDPVVKLLISVLLTRIRNNNRIISGERTGTDTTPDDLSNSALIVPDSFHSAHQRIKLEQDLLEALERKEFHLEYQPIVDLSNTAVKGFEALLRWNHPVRGPIPPDKFIDVAEQTSLIIPIGTWILHQAIHDLKWLQNKTGMPDLFISINVSSRQLNDPAFVDEVIKAQKRFKVDPKYIKMEVTERVFHEGPIVLASIDRCRKMGYAFSLDDFGTGYASMTTLFNLTIDAIKIDRTFVAGATKDPKSRAIVKAVVALALSMELQLVAEGIQDPQTTEFLRSLGCQQGQGYLFGKPMPLEQCLLYFTRKAA